MKRTKGLLTLLAFLTLCFLSTTAFSRAFLAIAQTRGWIPATATSSNWSEQGETASFVAQNGATYTIMLPRGKYSTYVGSSKRIVIIYNTRNPTSFFLPNAEKIIAFLFFFFFYPWLATRIIRYRRQNPSP